MVRAPDELLPPWHDAAADIVARGLWCVVEVCTHPPRQQWEPRVIVCERDSADIGDAIAGCISDWPQADLRIAGYTRDSLRRARRAPTALCHVPAAPAHAIGF